jgi:hypothetical protein
MSAIQSQIIENLGDCLTAMAAFAGGSIPATGSTAYTQWVTWIQLAQYDIARRGFWTRCLVPKTITITANVDYITLPDDFFKRNGIYVLNVGGEDWASNSNASGQKLHVYKNQTTGVWICKFIGYTPTTTVTDAVLWYFYNPPVPVDQSDALWFDGEMIMYGALKEYFRQSRQPGSQDDARLEYENRFNENLNLEMLPTPQELMSWKSAYDHVGLSPMDEVYGSSSSRQRS